MKHFIILFLVLFANSKTGFCSNDSTIVDDGELVPCEEIKVPSPPGKANYVINNDADYQNLFRELPPPYGGSKGDHPTIDFAKYTLLGVVTTSGGCGSPDYEHKVIKKEKNYQFILILEQNGMCEMLSIVRVWCLTPKISDDAQVEFKITNK